MKLVHVPGKRAADLAPAGVVEMNKCTSGGKVALLLDVLPSEVIQSLKAKLKSGKGERGAGCVWAAEGAGGG